MWRPCEEMGMPIPSSIKSAVLPGMNNGADDDWEEFEVMYHEDDVIRVDDEDEEDETSSDGSSSESGSPTCGHVASGSLIFSDGDKHSSLIIGCEDESHVLSPSYHVAAACERFRVQLSGAHQLSQSPKPASPSLRSRSIDSRSRRLSHVIRSRSDNYTRVAGDGYESRNFSCSPDGLSSSNNSRCGLCRNFGVGGAPTGAARQVGPAVTFAGVHGLVETDMASLSSSGRFHKNPGGVTTRSKAIPAPPSIAGTGLASLSSALANESRVAIPKWRQSAPVNFPPREKREATWPYSPPTDDDESEYNDWNNEIRIYPHELVARTKYSHRRVAFSVADGRGRTLRGRDMRRLRDFVMRNIMGYETQYPDGTLHELFKPTSDVRHPPHHHHHYHQEASGLDVKE